MPLKPRISFVPVAICCFGLLVLTLYPYQFGTPMRGWDFDKSVLDIAQNILLFLPLGVLVHQIFRRNVWRVAAFCAGFSLAIELLQLFSLHRFSNPFDILANTAGAFLGAWVSSRFFRNDPFYASISMLYLLLCWALGMRTSGFGLALAVFFLNGTIGLVALSRSLKGSVLFNWLARFGWSLVAVISVKTLEPLLRPLFAPVLLVLSGLFLHFSFTLNAFRIFSAIGLASIPLLFFTTFPLQLYAPFESRGLVLWLLILFCAGIAHVVMRMAPTDLQSTDIPLQS